MRQRLNLASVAILLLGFGGVCWAGNPHIVYQGQAITASGTTLSDGKHQAVFAVYEGPTAAIPVWREALPVTASNGLIKVRLGDKQKLDMDWRNSYWLGISFDGGPEGAPRQPLYLHQSLGTQTAQATSAELAYVTADAPLYEPQGITPSTTHPSGNWGSDIGSFEGVTAYSNGDDTGGWSSLEPVGTDGYQYQCVEYCRRFYRVHMGMTTSGWNGNADSWYGSGPGRGLEQHPNNGTELPQAEDILCFNSGSAGHVAIVTSASSSKVNVIQQNVSSSTAFGSKNIVSGIVQGSCQGWLRKPNPCTSATVSWSSYPTENRWYRSNEHLTYSYGGTSVSVTETPSAGNLGEMYLSEYGLGMHDYHVHVSGCNSSSGDINWHGGYDTQAPDLAWNGDCAPVQTWLRGTQYAKWHWSDALSSVKGGWYAWNGSTHYDGGSGVVQLPEGKNTLQIYCEDDAWNGGDHTGNSSTISGEFWLDNGAPVPSFTGPATGTWLNKANAPYVVNWGATDATSDVAVKTLTWDNGGATNASPAQIPEGKRSATVWAKDNALNEASQTFGPWWVDTTPPVPGVALSPSAPNGDNGWYVSDPTMSVVATDPNGADGSGVSGRFYTLDGAPEVPFTTPVLVSGNGIHTCSARATDVAGNAGSTGDMIVKIDTTPPVFDSIYTNPESCSLSTLSASWSCYDSDSGIWDYQYWIGTTPGNDDTKAATGTGGSNWAYVTNLNLALGQTYYFTVRAKNAAGLWSGAVTSQGILAALCNYDASPNLNIGGESVAPRTSPNYKIKDTLAQFVVASSDSSNFWLEHGYWHSEIGIFQAASPSAAKAVENGKTLQLGTVEKPVIVTSGTATFADRFYIESADRSSGMACQYGAAGGPTLLEGDQVWLIGKLNTVGSERMLQFASPAIVGHDDPLAPMYIGVPFIGGVALNQWTPGVLGGYGLNNIGLLVRTYGGLVSYRDPQGRFFYLDNGDNLYDGYRYGIRVICDGFVGGGKHAMPAYGKTVIVTGISSVVTINNNCVRALRPRRQADIQLLN